MSKEDLIYWADDELEDGMDAYELMKISMPAIVAFAAQWKEVK